MRDWYLIKKLARFNDVTLLTRVMQKKELLYVKDVNKVCNKVITKYITSPKNLLESFTRILNPLFNGNPLSTGTNCFSEIGELIYNELSDSSYDVIQIEHTTLSYYLKYIPSTFEGIKVIDLHNLETKRFETLSKIEKLTNFKRIFLKIDAKRMKKFEKKSFSKI